MSARRERVPTSGRVHRSEAEQKADDVPRSARASPRLVGSARQAVSGDGAANTRQPSGRARSRPQTADQPMRLNSQVFRDTLNDQVTPRVRHKGRPRLSEGLSQDHQFNNSFDSQWMDLRFNQDIENDNERKRQLAEAFVERNQEYMDVYSSTYRNKTLDEVLTHMVDTPGFVSRLEHYVLLERSYKKGRGSERVKACLGQRSRVGGHHDMEAILEGFPEGFPKQRTPRGNTVYGKRGQARQPCMDDPFLNSISTAREVRETSYKNLFAPTWNSESSVFAHTRGTIPEYGNFAGFVSELKKSSPALLNR